MPKILDVNKYQEEHFEGIVRRWDFVFSFYSLTESMYQSKVKITNDQNNVRASYKRPKI